MDTPDSQIDYAAVLVDLEARKAALEAAIAAVKPLVGLPGGAGGGGPAIASAISSARETEIRPDSFFGMGVADAARKYLTLMKGPKTLKEISDGLVAGGFQHTSANFIATLHTALTRRNKEFVRVKRGQWGLLEWYPGLRQGREQE